MACSIELLSESNEHQWEMFNATSPQGSLFHDLRWKQVLEDVFHLKLRYYLIRSDREVVGISPWVEQSVMSFRGLVSIPHADENGILLDDGFDINQFGEILSLFAKKNSFLHFNTGNRPLLYRAGFYHEQSADTGHMAMNLRHNPPEAIWAGLSKSTRQAIRAFENDGFQIRVVDKSDDLKDFYRYYTQNLTHIRGEILPLAFFEKIWEVFFPDELRVTVLTRDDLFAGGSVALLDPTRKVFYGNYLALNRDLPNRYTPAYYIMWGDIDWAWRNGYERLSFGRQSLKPQNSRFHNKVKFGAQYLPIHTNVILFSKSTSTSYKFWKMLSGNR